MLHLVFDSNMMTPINIDVYKYQSRVRVNKIFIIRRIKISIGVSTIFTFPKGANFITKPFCITIN